LVRWARRAGTIDFVLPLAALVSLEQNFIFLTAHLFTLLVPVAQYAGQAVELGRLSLCRCSELTHKRNFCEIRVFGFQRITFSEFAKLS
jgi:hypothetical protein